MPGTTSQKLILMVDRLIANANATTKTARTSGGYLFVDDEPYAKLMTGCEIFVRLLGDMSGVSLQVFESREGTPEHISRLIGTLTAFKEALEQDLLIKIESLVMAQAFGDLLEQADHLFEQGYHLA